MASHTVALPNALLTARPCGPVEKKGLLGGAFMLTRVKMQSGGQLAVDALVRAESEAFRAGGENDLARASADALEKFLRKHKQPERTPPAGGAGVPARGQSPKRERGS